MIGGHFCSQQGIAAHLAKRILRAHLGLFGIG